MVRPDDETLIMVVAQARKRIKYSVTALVIAR